MLLLLLLCACQLLLQGVKSLECLLLSLIRWGLLTRQGGGKQQHTWSSLLGHHWTADTLVLRTTDTLNQTAVPLTTGLWLLPADMPNTNLGTHTHT